MMRADSYTAQTATERKEHSYQGRPIEVIFHTTPMLYLAYFRNEYDGATDSRNPVGYGNTEEEAVVDLIQADSDMSDATGEQP
jgi:hypothetical protein